RPGKMSPPPTNGAKGNGLARRRANTAGLDCGTDRAARPKISNSKSGDSLCQEGVGGGEGERERKKVKVKMRSPTEKDFMKWTGGKRPVQRLKRSNKMWIDNQG